MTSSPTVAENQANSSVLDASALLAFILHEPGEQSVGEALRNGCIISAVNLTEVITRLVDLDFPDPLVTLGNVTLDVRPFNDRGAWSSAALRSATRPAGLSLGDRVCLALAQELGLPALTGDRRWATLDLGIDVQLIR